MGATGVIPITRYAGTFYTTPGRAARFPLEDKALLAAGHEPTRRDVQATRSRRQPRSVPTSAGLTATQRAQQAELLLRRPIASVEAGSYEGKLPSRAQVITAAARAHNLHGALVAAFILAEQRDQSQAEDAKDYQGATSLMQGNTSIGLGQVVVSTARSRDLFADLVSDPTRTQVRAEHDLGPGHEATARLLASDEYNIFAVARYIRQIADQGATKSLAALPVHGGTSSRGSTSPPMPATPAPGRTTTSGRWGRSTPRRPGMTGWSWTGPTSSTRPTSTCSRRGYSDGPGSSCGRRVEACCHSPKPSWPARREISCAVGRPVLATIVA